MTRRNSQNGATLTFAVHFESGRTRHRSIARGAAAPDPAPRGQVPRLTRVLALAHHFAELIRSGVVADYADLARLTGFTRARITQMMDLTLLAPDIQEQILTWPRVKGERSAPSEKRVRKIAGIVAWGEQEQAWNHLRVAEEEHYGPNDGMTERRNAIHATSA